MRVRRAEVWRGVWRGDDLERRGAAVATWGREKCTGRGCHSLCWKSAPAMLPHCCLNISMVFKQNSYPSCSPAALACSPLVQRGRRRRRSCTSARWRTPAASTACAPARSSRTLWPRLRTPRKCRCGAAFLGCGCIVGQTLAGVCCMGRAAAACLLARSPEPHCVLLVLPRASGLGPQHAAE